MCYTKIQNKIHFLLPNSHCYGFKLRFLLHTFYMLIVFLPNTVLDPILKIDVMEKSIIVLLFVTFCLRRNSQNCFRCLSEGFSSLLFSKIQFLLVFLMVKLCHVHKIITDSWPVEGNHKSNSSSSIFIYRHYV